MPPTILPAQVEEDAALTPQLFNLPDQASLDALVQRKINVAQAWLRQRAGPTVYNSTDADTQALLSQALSYLSLHWLTPILRAEKTYGTHAPYMSEEASSYDSLVERDWRQEAMDLLDPFLTLEDVPGKGFAPPQLLTSTVIDVQSLENESEQLEDQLAFSRNRQDIPFSTVSR